ncbi:MAG: TetR/AcrR family transcriptional regulator [Micropruina sp.]|uniref:TetR/AcrR family transcriptional regulator n=1 Tax=Micropruina sp. TaxID=2737536 RepID=UPI0039E3D643
MTTSTTDSRERLIAAMSALLWEKGYAATSPRDVMAAAEVGQGSFYHHFAGKHDLAMAALKRNVADSMAAYPRESGPSPLHTLAADMLRPRPGMKGCPVGRMTQDPQVMADADLLGVVGDAFATMLQRRSELIGAAIEAGELPSTLDADDLAAALAAVIQGGYVLSRALGSSAYMDAATRGAVALLEAVAVRTNPDPQTDETGRTSS